MGRPATGLRRPYDVSLALDQNEYEFLARQSHARKISRADLLRYGFFKSDWRNQLDALRLTQKNEPKKKFLPPKK